MLAACLSRPLCVLCPHSNDYYFFWGGGRPEKCPSPKGRAQMGGFFLRTKKKEEVRAFYLVIIRGAPENHCWRKGFPLRAEVFFWSVSGIFPAPTANLKRYFFADKKSSPNAPRMFRRIGPNKFPFLGGRWIPPEGMFPWLPLLPIVCACPLTPWKVQKHRV